jgi:hypothetical protein
MSEREEEGQGAEVEVSTDAVEIEIVDDRSDYEKRREERIQQAKERPRSEDGDDEVGQYSAGVKKRIDTLTAKYSAERVERERLARENEEAFRLANLAVEENRRLRAIAANSEKVAVQHAVQRAEADIERHKRLAREAIEGGDTEAALNHQQAIAQSTYELSQYRSYRPPEPEVPRPQQQPQRQTEPPKQDPKAASWAEKNTWFGKDEEMTGAAYGVHERLVKEGVDPRTDEYYQRLDQAIRRRFPENFRDERASGTTSHRQPSTVVAPASRSVGTPRRVTLTATQVALANRLGVTPEAYALELIKAQNNG